MRSNNTRTTSTGDSSLLPNARASAAMVSGLPALPLASPTVPPQRSEKSIPQRGGPTKRLPRGLPRGGSEGVCRQASAADAAAILALLADRRTRLRTNRLKKCMSPSTSSTNPIFPKSASIASRRRRVVTYPQRQADVAQVYEVEANHEQPVDRIAERLIPAKHVNQEHPPVHEQRPRHPHHQLNAHHQVNAVRPHHHVHRSSFVNVFINKSAPAAARVRKGRQCAGSLWAFTFVSGNPKIDSGVVHASFRGRGYIGYRVGGGSKGAGRANGGGGRWV